MLPGSTRRGFCLGWMIAVMTAIIWVPRQGQAQTIWFRRPIPTTTELQSVAYGGGFYSAVASGRAKVLQSRDGRVWTASPLPDVIRQVTYLGRPGREGFYGVGGTYFMKSIQSPAGYTLSNELDSLLSQAVKFSSWSSASAFGSRLAVLGTGEDLISQGVFAPVIALWEDTGWKIHSEPVLDRTVERYLQIDSVVLGESKILFFSRAGTNGGSESRVWIRSLSGFPQGDSWSTAEILPPSGASWGDLTAGAYGAGTFMLVGTGGKIFRIPEQTQTPAAMGISPNGSLPGSMNASLSGVAYGAKGGCWVAVGACGTVLYLEPRAQSWRLIPTRVLDDLNGVTYGFNSFVAVGEGGLILQSN
jgi:hypothetical protein